MRVERHVCRDCRWWAECDYCVMKPLYTHTDQEHECDEIDAFGGTMFNPIKNE